MVKKFFYFLMPIIVLGLVFSISSLSNLAFADDDENKEIKDQNETDKQQREQDREEAKQQREQDREEAKQQREQDREEAKQQREQDREDLKEFKEGVVVTSSSSSSVGMVTICHIPPGNSENAHTITIGKPALAAHLAHHDVEEPCEDADLSALDDSTDRDSRLSENSSQKESKALERAQNLIEKLQQQIAKLNERLQKLMEKYQSGSYYGNLSTTDTTINSYKITFDGTATSIFDEGVTTDMSGNLFMENQVTTSDTTKFRLVSGEIIVGNDVYDIVFGKARASSGTDGNDSLVIVAQTIDSEGNDNTVKIILGFDSNVGIGGTDEEFSILENSKISGQWVLDGNGNLTIES